MKKLSIIFILFILVGGGCLSPNRNKGVDQTNDTSNDPTQEEENILVSLPEDGDTVESPLVIEGSARVFENVVDWAITTEGGYPLQSGFFQTDAQDVGEFGDFSERIFLDATVTGNVVLEVFTYSAKDGEKQDIVTRHITVEETEKVSVNVYFVDPLIQGNDGCGELDVEKRTVLATNNVAELAIKELLAGPQSEWGVTEIPDQTELNRISISDSIATVEFTSPNITRWSGGACHVTALRKQIEETLLQFPSVDRVEILVNGNSEDILQP